MWPPHGAGRESEEEWAPSCRMAILAPYALADSDSGLRLFTGFIALFTALCALRILTALGLRLRARLSGTGPRLSSHLW